MPVAAKAFWKTKKLESPTLATRKETRNQALNLFGIIFVLRFFGEECIHKNIWVGSPRLTAYRIAKLSRIRNEKKGIEKEYISYSPEILKSDMSASNSASMPSCRNREDSATLTINPCEERKIAFSKGASFFSNSTP